MTARPVLPPLAVLAVLALLVPSCGGPSEDAPADAAPAAAVDASAVPDERDAATAPGVATFYADAADAICGALFRCCHGADLETYFAAYRASELLADFRDRLPPDATMDEGQCRAVVAEMLAVTPFGDWVHAAETGAVGFDGEAFASCTAALETAQCGEPVRTALFDSTCLGFAAPAGGQHQRAIFQRTAQPGTACSPIRDGVGAAFFGSCDPTVAFCCYQHAEQPELGCAYPFDGDGVPRDGVCTAAAAPGESCTAVPPIEVCRTGASCDPYTDLCVGDATAALEVGATCIDDNYNLLGSCTDSFCDMFGTKQCEALRIDGASCSYGYECAGGACVGDVCEQVTTCDGVPPDATPDAGPSGPDAGVPTPDAAVTPDAGSAPDAGLAATGETCQAALDLAGSSAVSELAGYDASVSGAFGETDDYNPYDAAGLPPACSIVYDAAGAEIVYAVELAPGDRLDLRYAVEPNTVPAGVYLLDGCSPDVTWPDYDESGRCGNNEYRSHGYCGFLGCDPLEWSWTYPTEVAGEATEPRTFWLVLDHLGTTEATGYQLDWRVVATD